MAQLLAMPNFFSRFNATTHLHLLLCACLYNMCVRDACLYAYEVCTLYFVLVLRPLVPLSTTV